jgi:hypothetical protein
MRFTGKLFVQLDGEGERELTCFIFTNETLCE